MAKYAFIKFKINNNFDDWEQAFYAHQPMARKEGILELFHAKQADDPSSVAVLMTANSFEVFDEFMKNAAEDISGIRTHTRKHCSNNVRELITLKQSS
jgi:hypothetical protein